MVHIHSGNLLEEYTFFAEEVPLPVPLVLGLLGLVLAAATLWLAVLPAPLHSTAAMGFGKDGTPIAETAAVASPPAPLPAPVPASPPPVAAPFLATPSVTVPSVAMSSPLPAPAAPAPAITVPVPPAPGVVPPPAPVVSAPVAVVAPSSPPPAQTPAAVVDAPVPPASAARSSPCAPLFAVAFDLAEAEPLVPELPARVDRLAAWLQVHPQARLIIEGHTDTSGSEAYNLALSQRRAMAVAHLMLATGTPADRLVTRGFGGERPLDGVSSRSGRNRRVAMRIAGAPECPAPTVQEAR